MFVNFRHHSSFQLLVLTVGYLQTYIYISRRECQRKIADRKEQTDYLITEALSTMRFLFMVSLHLSPLSLTFYIFLFISNFSCALWGRTPSLPPNVYLHLSCFFSSPHFQHPSLFVWASTSAFSFSLKFRILNVPSSFSDSLNLLFSCDLLQFCPEACEFSVCMEEWTKNCKTCLRLLTQQIRDIDQSWNHWNFGGNMELQTSSNLWVQISVRRIFQMNVRKIRNFIWSEDFLKIE